MSIIIHIEINKKMQKINLNLKFSKHIYRIMKQRKNSYMRKNKLRNLSWEEYLKIIVLVYGNLK
jgi:hypothetical protein